MDSDDQYFSDLPDESEPNDREAQYEQLINEKDRQIKELEAQFAQVENLINQLTSSQQEVTDLKKENQQLKLEKADVEHRLNIETEANAKLKVQLESEKAQNSYNRKEENESLNKSYDSAKAELERQISCLTTRNQELEAEISSTYTEQKVNKAKTERLLSFVSRYFDRDCSSLDDALALLEFPPPPPTEPEKVILPPSPNKSENKYKTKYQKAKSALTDLQNQLTSLESQSKIAMKQAESRIAEAEAEAEKQRELAHTAQSNGAARIAEMSQHTEALRNELAARNEEIRNTQSKLEAIQASSALLTQNDDGVKNKLSKDLKDAIRAKKEIEAREALQIKKAGELESKCAELENGIQQKEAEFSKLKAAHDALQIENGSLKQLQAETAKTAESLRSMLTNSGSQNSKQDDQKDDILKKQKQIVQKARHYKQQLEALKEESAKTEVDLQSQINYSVDALTKAERELEATHKEIDRLNEDNKRLRLDLIDSDAAISSLKETAAKAAVRPEIPSTAFHFTDSELQTIVDRISGNPSLQAATKVKKTCEEAEKYFLSKLTKHDSERLAEVTSLQKQVKSLNSILIDTSIALTDDANNNEQLPKVAASIRTERDSLRATASRAESSLSRACGVLKIEGDFMDGINTIADGIARQNEHIVALRKRIRKAAKDHEAHQKESAARVGELEAANAGLLAENETSRTKLAERERQLAEMATASQSLQRELEAMHATANETELQSRELARTDADGTAVALEASRRQYDEARAAFDQRAAELEASFEEASDRVAELESELRELHSENDNLIQKLEKCQSDHLLHEKQLNEEKNAAISAANAAKDEVHRELHKELEAARGDAAALSAELKESRQRADRLKSAAKKLHAENAALKQAQGRARQQAERERLLAEAQARMAVIEADGRHSEEIRNLEAKHSMEMQRALADIANSLRAFCVPTRPLDAREAAKVASRAADEIERLRRSDDAVRRIARAVESQTTEDAVARLLL